MEQRYDMDEIGKFAIAFIFSFVCGHVYNSFLMFILFFLFNRIVNALQSNHKRAYNTWLKNDTQVTYTEGNKMQIKISVIDISHIFWIPLASFHWFKYLIEDFIGKCKIFDCEKLESIAFSSSLLNRKKVRLMCKIERYSA